MILKKFAIMNTNKIHIKYTATQCHTEVALLSRKQAKRQKSKRLINKS
jgi:hypothetical protein